MAQQMFDASILDRIARFRSDGLDVPGTWPAKRELAAALRELLDCVCATDASEDELHKTADVYTVGEVYAGDEKTAEATGVFISIDRAKFEELNARRQARQSG